MPSETKVRILGGIAVSEAREAKGEGSPVYPGSRISLPHPLVPDNHSIVWTKQTGFTVKNKRLFFLSALCSWLIIEFQLLPYYSVSDWINVAGLYIGFSLLLVLLLRQSYVHCRREPSRRVIFKCSLILVISLFLPLWLSSDISSSGSYMSPKIAALYNNLREATSKLPAFIKEDVMYEAKLESFNDAVKKAKPIAIEEIDRAVILSPETRRWLRGATLRFIGPPVASKFSQTVFFVWVNVTFPDGRNFLVSTWW